MRRSHSPPPARQKATWGSRVASRAGRALRLVGALAVILFVSVPALAAPGQGAKNSGVRASKLDIKLEERARTTAGESDVIIEFNDDADALDVIAGFGNAGRKLGIINGYAARVPNHLLRELAKHGRVKKVSDDRPVATLNGRSAITTGARTVQQLSGYSGAGIGVAVIDSGITSYHIDLSFEYGKKNSEVLLNGAETLTQSYSGQRVAHFKDFVSGKSSTYDDYGHGTHVAGIIAGNGAASYGDRKAMAPGASIVALKALDGSGQGAISNVIAAIDYAVSVKSLYNIRVINLSLGAGVYESYETDPLTLAAKRAVEAGIVVVAAAGNLGKAADGTPQYGAITAPANAPWVLTVGASSTEGTTDRADDVIAGFSSRGPTMYDHRAKPDLVAPGAGTVSLSNPWSSLYLTKPQLLLPGAYDMWYLPYMSLSGTSMAAPVVSGSVALMLQANPNLTPNLVKAILQFTSQVYGGYNPLTQGAGFLNTRAAVQLAEYFHVGAPGTPYPDMTGWSKQIYWGNYRTSGGVLTPGGSAWDTGVVWGGIHTPAGLNVVWGDNCTEPSCDNVVWGNTAVWGSSDAIDNVVWGNTDDDNVVWGNGNAYPVVWGNGESDNVVWGNVDNVVWGNDCGGGDCDNVVWGNSCDPNDPNCDNVVWGNCDGDGCDNVVWGNDTCDPNDPNCDNVVWGDCEGDNCDNVVWGNDCDPNDPNCDNVVWGNSFDEIVFGDETVDVKAFDATIWDDLFKVTALAGSAGSR